MSSPLMAILAIAPIAALISLSVSMYKWDQQHLQVESLAGDSIFTCRQAAYMEILVNHNIPKDQKEKMVNVLADCDDNMLYYKGRCEIQPTKVFCSNSALDGYLILRGIENAERPAGFTKT
ncbi:MAG: hypothetical protein ACR2IS_01795 [Nitrososphaeraceae archaeon]